MGYAFVQTNYSNQGFPSSGNGKTFSPTAGAAVGDLVVLVLGMFQGNTSGPLTVSSVTDTAGNTWTVDQHDESGSHSSAIVSCLVSNAITPSDSITITLSAAWSAGSVFDVDLVEFSGAPATGTRVDQKAAAGTYGTSVTVTLPASTTDPGDLLILTMMGGGGTITWPAGYTKEGLRAYWNLPGSTSAFSETITDTSGADMAASMVAYLPGGSGGGGGGGGTNTKGNFFAWIGT